MKGVEAVVLLIVVLTAFGLTYHLTNPSPTGFQTLNQPPTALASTVTADTLPFVINLGSYFSDADGDSLTFSADDPAATIQNNTLTFNPQRNFSGEYTITLTVSDGTNTIAKPFTIVVSSSQSISEQNQTLVNQTLSPSQPLRGTISEPAVQPIATAPKTETSRQTSDIHISSACSSCATCTACAASNAATCTLDQNITTSLGDCITITANSVTLDCAGNTIDVLTSSGGYAIFSDGRTGLMIKNCRINKLEATSTLSYVLYLTATTSSTVQNNVVTSNTDSIVLSATNGIVTFPLTSQSDIIENNSVFTYANGINILAAGNTTVRGNNVTASNDTAGYAAIQDATGGNNVYSGNSVIANNGNLGLGVAGTGTYLNIAENNTVNAKVLGLYDFGTNTRLYNNTLRANESSGASAASSGAARLGGQSSTIVGNSFSSSAVTVRMLSIGNLNTIENNTFFTNSTWFYVTGDTNTTLRGNLFSNQNGSINITGTSIVDDANISTDNLNISLNRTFLNSTNLSFLNTTANITLNGLTFTNPLLLADYEDDGTYVTCASGNCTLNSYSGGVLKLNVSHFTSYAVSDSGACPGTITTDTTLTGNISSTGTCITIGANNVALDCAGYNISYSSDSAGAGVSASSRDNITIKNCLISLINESVGTPAISLSTITHGVIQNVTAIVNGSAIAVNLNGYTHGIITNNTFSSVNNGALSIIANNYTISQNTLTASGAGSPLILQTSTDGLIESNYALSTGSAQAIVVNTGSRNNTFTNNTVSSTLHGFLVTNAHNNTIQNNTIVGSGSGIQLQFGTDRTQVTGNTINSGSRALVFQVATDNNTITNNLFNSSSASATSGGTNNTFISNFFTAQSQDALFLGGNLNFFDNNTVDGGGNPALSLGGCENSTFIDNTVRSTTTWLSSTGSSTNNTFSNLRFNNSAGNILSNNTWLLPENTTVGISNLSITANRTFINSTRLPFLNTTAQITLNNIAFTDPRPKVDFEDDGTFANCGPPQCNETSYAGGTFVFNVSHFTSYAASETVIACGDTLTTSTTLVGNLSATGDCFKVGADNVVLDCNGYTISGNSATDFAGVNVSGYNHATIKNCNISNFYYGVWAKDGSNYTAVFDNNLSNNTVAAVRVDTATTYANITRNNVVGISRGIWNTNFGAANQVVNNNTVSGAQYGIMDFSVSNITNNHIMGASQYGIYLQGVTNNRVENNQIHDGTGGMIINSGASNNIVTNNTIANNSGQGLRLSFNSGNVLRNNTFTNNSISIDHQPPGTSALDYNNDVDTSNTIEGLPIYYYYGLNNTVLDALSTKHLTLAYSQNVVVRNINITSGDPITFAYSGNISVNNVSSSGAQSPFQFVRISESNVSNLYAANPTSGSGTLIYGTHHVNFTNVTISNSSSFGLMTFFAFGSHNNTFNNTLLSHPSTGSYTWMTISTGADTDNTLWNTTFLNSSSGTAVNYRANISPTAEAQVSSSKITLGPNITRVNSANLTFLNTSAQITLPGLTFTNPRPIFDGEDDGTYVVCNPPQCNETSYAGGTFVFNVSRFTSYAASETVIACGDTLTSDTNLTQNLSCASTGLTIGADNVALDCNGSAIRYDTAGIGGSSGVTAVTRNNITVRNCLVLDANASGSTSLGLNLSSVTNSTFTNNIIVANGTDSMQGISVGGGSANTIENNTILSTGTSTSQYGVSLQSTHHNILRRNNITSNASFDSDTVIISSANNNTVSNNTVFSITTSANGARAVILFSNSGDNVIDRNSLRASEASSVNDVVQLQNAVTNNITNNIISGNSGGMRLELNVNFNNVINNSVNGSGVGIFVNADARNNTIFGNNLTSAGYAITIGSSGTNSFNQFVNNVLDQPGAWISSTSGSNNLTNTTFKSQSGRMRFPAVITISGAQDVTLAKVDTTFNQAFVNSANLSFLNASAQITLENITFTDPRPKVDFEDDSTFVNCDPPQCTEISYNGSTYVFNVSHFTTYISAENVTDCGTITSDTLLTANISSAGTCISFGADDITLDCLGHTITYANGSLGYGINATGRTNITIKNCLVVNATSPVAAELHGIILNATTNSTIANTTSYGTGNGSFFGSGAGIMLLANSNNNNINNDSGAGRSSGIWIFSGTENRIMASSGSGGSTAIRTDGGENNVTDSIAFGNQALDISGSNGVLRNITSTASIQGAIISGSNLIIDNITTIGGDASFSNIASNSNISNIHASGSGGINIQGNNNNVENVTGIATTSVGFIVGGALGRYRNISGTATSGFGLFAGGGADNNNLTDVSAQTNTGTAFEVVNSENNSITNVLIHSNGTWVASFNSFATNLTNATFAGNNGTITYPNTVSVPNGSSVTQSGLVISSNHVFLNSTSASFLNTTARVSFGGVIAPQAQPMIDFEDDSTFVPCVPPSCTFVSYTGGILTFDVTHFTSFSSTQGGVNTTLSKDDSIDPLNLGSGTLLNYTINFTVTDGAAFNTTIFETYPASVSFVSASPSPSAGNGTWDAGNLSVNSTYPINITINVSATLPNGYVINNTVNATYQNSSGDALFVNVTESTTITSTACPGTITIDTVLTQNVSSTATCVTFGTDNISLDCRGNTINYSSTIAGNGVLASGRSNVTVRNCNIHLTNTSLSGASAILYTNTNDSSVINTTTNASADTSAGIEVAGGSARNTIVNSSFNSTAYPAVFLFSVFNTTVTNVSGISTISTGINSFAGGNNTLTNVTTRGGSNSGIQLDGDTSDILVNGFSAASDSGSAISQGAGRNIFIENGTATAGSQAIALSGQNITLANVTAFSVSSDAVFVSTASRVTIRNVSGNGNNSGAGLRLLTTNDSNVLDSTFIGVPGLGLVGNRNNITRVSGYDTLGAAGFLLQGGENNTIQDSLGALLFGSGPGILLQNMHGTRIINTTGISPTQGGISVQFNSNYTTIINSTGEDTSGNGIDITSGHSNYVFNSIGRANASGFGININTGNNTVANVSGMSSTSTGIAIQTSGNTLENSTAVSTSGTGLYVAGSAHNITNNTGITSSGVASFAGITSDASTSLFVNNSGQGAPGLGLRVGSGTNNTFAANRFNGDTLVAVYYNTATYTLFVNNDISGPNGGFQFDSGATDNTLTQNRISTATSPGVQIAGSSHRNNITQNNITAGSSNAVYIIAQNNTIVNNTITNTGGASVQIDGSGGPSSGNLIANNSVNSVSSSAILVQSTSDTTITNNTVQITSSGIGITIISTNRTRVSLNQITASSGSNGIHVQSTSGSNLVTNNTISGATNGIILQNGINTNNTFINNTVLASASAVAPTSAYNNTFAANQFTTSGNQVLNTLTAGGNTYANNTFTGGVSRVILIQSNVENDTYLNNTLNIGSTTQWFAVTGTATNTTISNTTFNQTAGSILLTNATLRSGTDIALGNLSITVNRAYLNSTNLSFLNSSAQITLLGVNVTNGSFFVDAEDDGTFINCDSPQCVDSGSNGSTYIFDVTHFTTYKIAANATCPFDITTDTTLTQNISCAATAVNILSDNVALDCAGYNISYSATSFGYGINATDRNNITIKNCAVTQSTPAGIIAHAIQLSSTNNSNIMNTTTSAQSLGAFGISLRISHGNTVTNSSGTTSGSLGAGISLFFTNDTIVSNSSWNQTVNAGYGISLTSAYNNTLINNTAAIETNSYALAVSSGSSNNTITNNSLFGGTSGLGIWNSQGAANNLYFGNTVFGQPAIDIQDFGSDSNTVMNNTAVSTTSSAIQVSQSHNNTVRDNSGTTTSGTPFVGSQMNDTTITNNTFFTATGSGGIVSSSHNNTVFNNTFTAQSTTLTLDTTSDRIVVTNNSFSTTSGIGLQSQAPFSLIFGNTLFAGTTGTYALGQSANDATIANNIASSNNSAGTLQLTGALRVNVTGNIVSKTAAAGGVALQIDTLANDNYIFNNTGTSPSGTGILAEFNINNTFINNTGIATSGTGFILSSSSNDTLLNNTGISNSGIGVLIASNNNSVIGTIALSSTSTAFAVFSATNNTITNSRVQTGPDAALAFSGSTNNAVDNISLQTTGSWITTDATSTGNTLTRAAFNASNGSILVPPLFTMPALTSVTLSNLKILLNRSFINSTNLSFLNTSAQVTLLGVTVSNATFAVDPEDDGTYVACNSPQCVDSGSAGTTYIFNVTHWTSYAISTNATCPLTISTSTVLGANVTCPATAIILGADNIALDCAGYTLNYSSTTTGNGIDASGRTNIAIRNCNIQQTNTSINSSHAILFAGTNQSSVTNSTIALTSSFSRGISLSTANANNFSNNSISTTSGEAILFANAQNNLVSTSTLNSTAIDALDFVTSQTNTVNGTTFSSALINPASNGNRIENSTGLNAGSIVVAISNSNNTILRNNTLVSTTAVVTALSGDSNTSVINNTIQSNSGVGISPLSTTRATIRNNTVTTDTSTAVNLDSASNHNTVDGNVIHSNGNAGLRVSLSNNVTASSNTVSSGGFIAVQYVNSAQGIIANNTATATGSNGISLTNTNNTLVENNTAASTSGNALDILAGSNNNTLRNNTASSVTGNGLSMTSSNNNTITNMTVSGTSATFLSDSDNNTLSRVTATSSSNALQLASGSDNNTIRDSLGISTANHALSVVGNGNTLVNNTAIGNTQSAVLILNAANNTVINNSATALSNQAYQFTNVTGTLVLGSNGSSNTSQALAMNSGSTNNVISSGSFTSNTSQAIILTASSNNTVQNNTATGRTNRGIQLDTGTNNTLVANNTVTSNASQALFLLSNNNNTIINNIVTSTSNTALQIVTSSNNVITNNSIASNTSQGASIQTAAIYNTFTNNTFFSNSSSAIVLSTASGNNTFVNNTVTTNTGIGIFVLTSGLNNFTNTNINSRTGILFSGSTNLLFNHTNITSNSTWISIDAASVPVPFSDTLLADPVNGSVYYPQTVTAVGASAVAFARFNISNNTVRLSSANLTFLNTSAQITLRNISGTARPIVDDNDDALATYCNPPQCTLISFTSGTLIFNVTGFTTYSTTGNVSIDKTDSPDPIPAGATLTYQLQINNTGTETLSNTTVTETYPAGVNFVSSTPAPSSGNNTFALGSLTGTTSTTINITVTVGSNVANGTVLNNTMNLTFANPQGINLTTTDSELTTVLGSPRVFTSKTDSPDPIARGALLSYTLTVSNTGDEIAYNTTAVETYPPGVSFVGSTPAPTLGNDTFDLGALGAGQTTTINITVLVGSNVANGTILNNSYDLSFVNSTGSSTTLTNSTTTTVLGNPVIVAIKSDTPDPVTRGGTLNYTILINNTGDDTAFNVSLTENYPSGVAFVSAQPAPTLGNNSFTLGNLAPNQSTLVNITVTVGINVGNGTILNNTVNASFRNSSGLQSSVSDTELTTVIGFPTILATKLDTPDPVTSGSTLSYKITISNFGDEIAYNLTIGEGYPANVVFNNASPVPTFGNNTFSLGNLLSGQTTTINITVNVSPTFTGILFNTANITFQNVSGASLTQTANASTTVNPPTPTPTPSGGGGGGGGGTTVSVAQSYTFDQSTTQSLKANDKVSFSMENELHTLTLIDVTDATATIEIASTPRQYTLFLGQERDLDVTGNGQADLHVRLDNVYNGRATLTIGKITQTLTQVKRPTQTPASSETGLAVEQPSGTPAPETAPSPANPLAAAASTVRALKYKLPSTRTLGLATVLLFGVMALLAVVLLRKQHPQADTSRKTSQPKQASLSTAYRTSKLPAIDKDIAQLKREMREIEKIMKKKHR